MRAETVVAIIQPELQNDLVAALHARNVGHIAKVIREDRGNLMAQIGRVSLDTTNAPESLATAQRILIVSAAYRSPELGWLLLQRGATSVWIVSPGGEWSQMGDMPLEIAATADLAPRPIPPAHRSSRTFRPSKHRRRSRHVPAEPSPRSNHSRPPGRSPQS